MKRIISVFVLLAMCVALLPMPIAAQVPVIMQGKDRLGSEPVTYYFDCFAFYEGSEADKTPVSQSHNISAFTDAGYENRSGDSQSAKWGLFGISSTNNAQWRTQSLEWKVSVSENGAVFTESDDAHYVIFELDVPEPVFFAVGGEGV